jgi:hypothetical protein
MSDYDINALGYDYINKDPDAPAGYPPSPVELATLEYDTHRPYAVGDPLYWWIDSDLDARPRVTNDPKAATLSVVIGRVTRVPCREMPSLGFKPVRR